VSYHITVAAEAPTIAETLLKPSAAENYLGNNRKRNLTTVQLSNNAVTRRIQDLSVDTEKKLLVSGLKIQFACLLHHDESTHVPGLALYFYL
jgi:hypothetical protein